MDDIYHCRLINGDEVYGPVIKTDSGLTIDYPLVVIEIDTPEGSTTALTPYAPLTDKDECIIEWHHIITYNKVHPEVGRYYMLNKYFAKDIENDRLNQTINANKQMIETIQSDQLEQTSLDHFNNESKTLH